MFGSTDFARKRRAIALTGRAGLLISAAGVVAALSGGISLAGVVPSSWEVASEFNDTTNPSGVWSYGYKTTLNGSFTLYTANYSRNNGQMYGWGALTGEVTHNIYPYIVPDSGSDTIVWPAHALDFVPGTSCEYAVLRFTAPKSGKYRISGAFYGLDNDSTGTTTDVEILVNNGSPVFTANIDVGNGSPKAPFTSLNVVLKKNSTLDFQTGCGSNGTYLFDHTGLNAVIEQK
jgi:hypothetical protein